VPGTVVVGTQWGDEGKAKVIDLLASSAKAVVRYQGGANAGHTVVVDGEKYAFRLIPSGIVTPNCLCVIGNGVVLDADTLFAEMDMLISRGHDLTGRVVVSPAAHVVLPFHKRQDEVLEERRGAQSLGTTKNGIGPAYTDKVARDGIRVADLFEPTVFRDRLRLLANAKEALLGEPVDTQRIEDHFLGVIAPRLQPLVADTVDIIHTLLDAGENVLFEGAQATFLDIDHGTYPFVTSSNPVAGFASVGSGVGPRHLQRIVGIAKAYVTRVGAGPFPTELHDETGEGLRSRGREFGTVTGRPRRCGWFDAVMLRQAARLNSLTEIALTKLDILDPLATISVCVAYDVDGQRLQHLPSDPRAFARAVPIYEQLPGWAADTSSVTSFADLPPNAQAYVSRLQELVGVPITIVGTGPGREQVLTREVAGLAAS
jgi:adenylosuccinate synthase